ncbi:MAG: type II toxin-antitoxin system VapC family toxin [Bacteroidota bacterium]
MRVLLDTHALLWFLADDARLGRRAEALIRDAGTDVLVSTASLWEIAIKHSLGKLPLAQPFAEMFPAQLKANDFEILTIQSEHLVRMVGLPFHHRDPFDRLLIAQALAEDIPLLSRDGSFGVYDVGIVWQ